MKVMKEKVQDSCSVITSKRARKETGNGRERDRKKEGNGEEAGSYKKLQKIEKLVDIVSHMLDLFSCF